MPTYLMDDATFQHLTTFCDRFFRDDEATNKRNAVVSMLEAMPPEDAEYSLSHGWPHVVGLL